MEYDEGLYGSLQENILALLVFDKDAALQIRNIVQLEQFESRFYRDIASRAVVHLDQFSEPIGEHIADELEEILKGSDKKKAKLYETLLDNLWLSRDDINSEYVLSKLHEFIRQQTLKTGIMEASKHVLEGRIDEAENVLEASLKKRVDVFDPGLRLHNTNEFLGFLDETNDALFHTGIPELDKRGVCPQRGEMYLFIAPSGFGKSWFMVHMAKRAMMERLKVLHVTLEMSQNQIARRYTQAMFAVTRYKVSELKKKSFELSRRGELEMTDIPIKDRPNLNDPDIRKFLRSKASKVRVPMIVKRFPTGGLTISQLRTYMLLLERTQNFVPDLLIVDYLDLMAINPARVREETGTITKELRGLAVEFNAALVTATQGNRKSASARTVRAEHVAEDWSKIATSDIVLTLSRTEEEERENMARIFVAKARDTEDKFTVLISQLYPIGQFVMESIMLPNNYRYGPMVADDE